MKRAILVLVLLGLALSVSFAAGTTEKGKKKLVVGYSLMTMMNPQYYDCINEIKKVVEEENGGTLIMHDSQFDAAKQVAGMENFISQQVSGIIVNAVEERALYDVLKKAREAGIPVVCMDSEVASPDKTALVTSDNYDSGVKIGQYLASRLRGKGGNVLLIDYRVLSDCRKRIQGIKDALKDYPEVKILDEQKGGSMTDALKLAETWVQKFPVIDAIYGINDQNALGALTALTSAGRTKAFVVGNDGTPEAYQAMADKRNFEATIQQQSKVMGHTAIMTLLKAIKGEKIEQKDIFIPVYLVTQKDVLNGITREDVLAGKLGN